MTDGVLRLPLSSNGLNRYCVGSSLAWSRSHALRCHSSAGAKSYVMSSFLFPFFHTPPTLIPKWTFVKHHRRIWNILWDISVYKFGHGFLVNCELGIPVCGSVACSSFAVNCAKYPLFFRSGSHSLLDCSY